MLAAIVETGRLGRVVGYSLAAGVGVAIVFSLGVSSTAGLLDALRARRTGAATLWGTIAALCGLAALGAAVLGIVVMAQK
jgi:hypothetical protein